MAQPITLPKEPALEPPPPAQSASPANRLPAWVLLLGALTALGPLSIDMYLPGFPAIAASLGSDMASVQLSLAVFLVGMGLGQLLYGPLSDRFGRKPPLYAGLLIYIAASIACALVNDIVLLTAWRFLQALGGSAAVVISRAVVRDRTNAREAARAFSLLMLVMGLAPILAPLLGGWVLLVTGWRGIFWLLAWFGVLLLIAVRFALSETVSRREAPALRPRQVMRGYARLLQHRRFMAYTLSGALAFAGMFAYIAISPHVLIELYGIPAHHFGWLFGLNALGLIAASQVNGWLLRHAAPETILGYSMWIPPLGALLVLVPVLVHIHNLTLLMFGLFVFLSSLGFIGPNTTALALAQVERREAGAAAALIGTLQFLLGTAAGVGVSLWLASDALPLAATLLICSAGALLLHKAAHPPASPELAPK